MSMIIGKRLTLVVVPAALVVTTVLGVFLGRIVRASSLEQQGTGYTQCSYLTLASGSTVLMSFQSASYTATSAVDYAQVFDPSGNSLGYWSVNNQATVPITTNGNTVYVITAVFNTALLTNQPTMMNEKPSVNNPLKPEGATKAPTTGSTICLSTNKTYTCPTPPIPIVVTPVNPCP